MPGTEKIKVIADLHGFFDILPKLVEDLGSFVIAGDVGIGFNHDADMHLLKMLEGFDGKVRFLRGNHDDLSKIRGSFYDFFIPDGTIEDGVLFLGGAESIDRAARVPGYSWWPDEGLPWGVVERLGDLSSVHTIVAHDCPGMWYPKMGINSNFGGTAAVLDHIVSRMVPNLRTYVHGHHHKPLRYRSKNGINVVSLAPADKWRRYHDVWEG